MNDFKKEYTFIKKEINDAITRCLESGWYILGEETKEFEEQFAKYVGTKYCVGVANGLEALQISLMALGIGQGDEVITVSNSAVATALAITNAGAKPIFADVDDYYHIDVDQLEPLISPNTKAIIPVHLFGQMVDIKKLKEFADKHNLYIIEDACQAHGAQFGEQMSGSIGELGCFSFYPTKNLGGYGDGGAITTNSKKLYEKCLMLRNYGQKDRYYHEIKGLNSRLDELQSAVLKVKLKHVDKFIEKRRELANAYFERLKNINEIRLPKVRDNHKHSFHLFVIKAQKRDELLNFLKSSGVNALIHYPVPIHKQKCYSEFNNIKLPRTEEYANTVLSLPIHPFLEIKEVKKVCELIEHFYKSDAN